MRRRPCTVLLTSGVTEQRCAVSTCVMIMSEELTVNRLRLAVNVLRLPLGTRALAVRAGVASGLGRRRRKTNCSHVLSRG